MVSPSVTNEIKFKIDGSPKIIDLKGGKTSRSSRANKPRQNEEELEENYYEGQT